MTLTGLKELGLTHKEARDIMQMLNRSHLSGSTKMLPDSKGRLRDTKYYDDVRAMSIVRARLDYTCMKLVKIYDEQ